MRILKLVIALAVCQLAGIIGSIFNAASINNWYTTINKPFFNPPGWIFAPVWISLFVLMGISLYLVWKEDFKKVKIALLIFGIQLVLNIFWSFFFFYLKSPGLAFIEIIILWVFILLTILKFMKISKTTAYLLIPYIVWVSFAAILNFAIWFIN